MFMFEYQPNQPKVYLNICIFKTGLKANPVKTLSLHSDWFVLFFLSGEIQFQEKSSWVSLLKLSLSFSEESYAVIDYALRDQIWVGSCQPEDLNLSPVRSTASMLSSRQAGANHLFRLRFRSNHSGEKVPMILGTELLWVQFFLWPSSLLAALRFSHRFTRSCWQYIPLHHRISRPVVRLDSLLCSQESRVSLSLFFFFLMVCIKHRLSPTLLLVLDSHSLIFPLCALICFLTRGKKIPSPLSP